MKCPKEAMLLYGVTDRSWLKGQTLCQQVEEALKGGVTCLQLREKCLPDEEFLQEAFAMKELCRKYAVPFIINDNVSIAVKCGATGVHVGQKDMQAADVRRLIGDDMILGVSAQTVDQALLAEKNGADYLGVGAVFPTDTKEDADAVAYDTLKAICAAVSIPVVAIGGISADNMPLLKGSGIAGVALVSAIFASEDIIGNTRKLLKTVKDTVEYED